MQKKIFGYVLAAGLCLAAGSFFTAPVQAIPVISTVSGSVDIAVTGNPFGLTATDSVTAVAKYDDNLVPGAGLFSLAVDSNPNFELTITFGSFVFEKTADDAFGSGFPQLRFSNGNLVGFEFEIDGFSFGAFPDLVLGDTTSNTGWFLDEFVSGAPDNVLLEGAFDFANAVTVPDGSVAAMPEPAAWLLFAGGLFGLVGISGRARRRHPRA